jgi:hypothetical protein
MNKNIKIIVGIFLLSVVMFFAGKCSKDKDIITKVITIPAVIGSSDTLKNLKPISKILKDSIIYKDSTIYTYKEFDKNLLNKYKKLDSDYLKLKAYLESIEVNEYSIPIENEYLTTLNNFKVQGKLLNFQQDFKLKERNLEVNLPVPKTLFAMYAGVGLKSTTSLNTLQPTANIFLQNKSGNLLGIQYGLDQSIQVSYSIKIFDYKK